MHFRCSLTERCLGWRRGASSHALLYDSCDSALTKVTLPRTPFSCEVGTLITVKGAVSSFTNSQTKLVLSCYSMVGC